MKIIGSYNRYLKEKLTNKRGIITQAECDVLAVMESVGNGSKFHLLSLADEYYSWYECHKKDSKVVITAFREKVVHNLKAVLQKNIQSEIIEAMNGLSSDKECILFIRSEGFVGQTSLIGALKTLYKDVRPMPSIQNTDEINPKNFLLPDIKLDLGSDTKLSIPGMFSQTRQIHICLDSKTLSKALVCSSSRVNELQGLKLDAILPDTDPDYKIGDVGVKVLKPFYVETDGYQNVFLSVIDIHGNNKKCLIYSCVAQNDNKKKSAITLNSPQNTADMKSESSNIVRRAQYIAATKEIHNKVYDLLLTLLEDLREMVKSMLEKSYPDIDWLEQYQAAFVSNSSEKLQKKLKNLQQNVKEIQKEGGDLIECIDWPYMEQVLSKFRKDAMKCWNLNYNDFQSLKEAITCIAGIRPSTAHMSRRYKLTSLLKSSTSALTIA